MSNKGKYPQNRTLNEKPLKPIDKTRHSFPSPLRGLPITKGVI